jgi:site-specific recombinase XerD
MSHLIYRLGNMQKLSNSGWPKIGLDRTAYSTHTMRRAKATLSCRRTKNLRAVQLLLGHTKRESTVRYLGIEVDNIESPLCVGSRPW